MILIAEAGKFVGKKVAGVLITLAVLAGAWWCYQHPETVKSVGNVIKLTIVWTLIAAALPWSSYLFMRPLLGVQSRMQSANSAATLSIAVIAAFLVIDIVIALWLGNWNITGGFTWFVLILGFAAAGAYNFVICESLARHVDR